MPVELFGRVLAGEPIWIPLDGAELGTPISTEDVTDFIPALFDVASPSTTIVNLAGDEAVTITEFMTFLAQQAHLPIEIVRDDRARTPNPSDNARRKELLGDCRVHWRDGIVEPSKRFIQEFLTARVYDRKVRSRQTFGGIANLPKNL